MNLPILLKSSLRRMLVIAACVSVGCALLFLVVAIFTFSPEKSRQTYPLTGVLFMLAFVFALLFFLWFGCYQKGLVLSEDEVIFEFFGWRKSRTHKWTALKSWGEAPGLFILEFDIGKPYHVDAGILRPGDGAKLKDFLATRFFGSQVAIVYGVEDEPYLKRK